MTGSLERQASLPHKPPLLRRDYDLYPTIVPLTPSVDASEGLANQAEVTELLGVTAQLIREHTPELGWGQSSDKTKRMLEVAAITAEIGEDPSGYIEDAYRFLDRKRIIDYESGFDFWYPAAQIAAYVGDFEEAFERTEQASRKNYMNRYWPFMEIAPFIKEVGGDETPYFDKAAEFTVEHASRERHYKSLIVTEYLSLAYVARSLGRDASVWLHLAKDAADTVPGSYVWGDLGAALLSFREIDDALPYVEMIKDVDPKKEAKSRQDGYAHVARVMFHRGDKEAAIALATKFHLPKMVTGFHFLNAKTQVEAGENPEGEIEQALTVVDSLENLEFPPDIPPLQSILYSRAGRIISMAGKDPQPYFDRALELANGSLVWKRADAYSHIARDIVASGGDATYLLLDGADIAGSPGELDDIHESALACGYFYLASIIERGLESFRTREDAGKYKDLDRKWGVAMNEWQIHFMLDRARALADNSLQIAP